MAPVSPVSIEQFIARWEARGDAERANKDLFLTELCAVLGVEQPHPKTGDPRSWRLLGREAKA